MGEKFVGSEDHALFTTEALADGVEEFSAWVQLDNVDTYEVDIVLASFSGTDVTVIIETDIDPDHPAYTKVLTVDGTTKENVSLGGQPGGGKVRARVLADGSTATISVDLHETRSGR